MWSSSSFWRAFFYSLGTVLLLFGAPSTSLAQTDFFGEEGENQPPPAAPPAAPPATPQPQAPQAVAPQPTQSTPAGISRSDVILLMDVSGSMDAFDLGQNMSKLEAAKTALRNVLAGMQDQTRFQLWTFSEVVHQYPSSVSSETPKRRGIFEVVGPQGSPTRDEFVKVASTISIPIDGNSTNLYPALLQAMQHFYSHSYQVPPNGPEPLKVIVLLADGQDDQRSPVKLGTIMIAKHQFPDVQIKTIGFGIKEKSTFHRILCTLATEDNCALAQNTDQLQKVLSSFTAY